MTSFRPGQMPPQVTMAARLHCASWKIFFRGPAATNVGTVLPSLRSLSFNVGSAQ